MSRVDRRSPRAAYLAFGCVALAILLAYGRSFAVPYQFDDIGQILENQALRQLNLEELLGWGRARLIPFATLALNFQAGGDDVTGYHIVNLFVHGVATLFVFLLALTLCDTPRVQRTWVSGERLMLATAAAFVFACHPIQVQAVTYIIQRITSMAAMFYLGALYFYVRARLDSSQSGARGRTAAWYGGALVFALAAFLSKENTATLPIVIGLVELTFFGVPTRAWWMRLAPFFLLAAAIPLAYLLLWARPGPAGLSIMQRLDLVSRRMTMAADAKKTATPGEYFLTQCTVVPRYLGLVVYPASLNIDHDVPLARTVSAPVALGLAFLIALTAFGIYAARRWPLVGFGVLWVLITLSVESSFLPIADLMMEHRMYLPMAGVALVIGQVFAAAVRRAPRPAFIAGGMLAAALVILTMARNEVWRSPLSLWQDAVAKSPGKARPQLNVGTVLHLEGHLDEAIPYYCKALEIEPGNKLAQSNLNKLSEARMAALFDDEDDDAEDGVVVHLEAQSGKAKMFVAADPCKRE